MLSSNRTGVLDARLGQRIPALRLQRDYTVLAVAMQIGVSAMKYKQMEDGATHITASQLLTLTETLALSIAEFYTVLLD